MWNFVETGSLFHTSFNVSFVNLALNDKTSLRWHFLYPYHPSAWWRICTVRRNYSSVTVGRESVSIEAWQNPFVYLFLFLAKANEALEEVRNAEVMVNMTKEAADKAVMRAMDALARARNASDRMDKLIQVLLL